MGVQQVVVVSDDMAMWLTITMSDTLSVCKILGLDIVRHCLGLFPALWNLDRKKRSHTLGPNDALLCHLPPVVVVMRPTQFWPWNSPFQRILQCGMKHNDNQFDSTLPVADEDPWVLPLEISILQYSSHSITILNSESLKNSNHFQGKLSVV